MRTSSPRRAVLLSVGLLVFSVVLLQIDRIGQGPGPMGRVVTAVVSPLVNSITAAGAALRGAGLDYVVLVDVRAENRGLQSRIRDLQQAAAEAPDLAAENERLRRLLELADRRKDLRLRAARVSSRGTSPNFRVLRITLDISGLPVAPGMPVVAPGGVVGQIRTHVGDDAEVLLVTDPRSAIDVVMEQSRSRGVAVGTGEKDRYAARLEYVQRSAKLVPGERVLTTGDDGRYPRGLVVGVLEEVGGEGTGPFRTARVRPFVDLGALDEVFVVLGLTGLSPTGDAFENRR